MSKIPYRRPYPEQLRAEAVALVRSSGRPAREIARELGVSYESLRLWVKQSKIDAGEEPGLTSDERAELSELCREVRVLRQEREILKEAGLRVGDRHRAAAAKRLSERGSSSGCAPPHGGPSKPLCGTGSHRRPAALDRGSSRRFPVMPFRPANISLTHRRCPGPSAE